MKYWIGFFPGMVYNSILLKIVFMKNEARTLYHGGNYYENV